MASAPLERTDAPAGPWPDGKSSSTGCTGMTCPGSPCTDVHVGWTNGRYRDHKPHTCVPPPSQPVKRSAVSDAVVDYAARLHAAAAAAADCADHAGSVAAAAVVETHHPVVELYHKQHSPARFPPLVEWCGRLEVERAAATPRSCVLGCKGSVWQRVWPNPLLQVAPEKWANRGFDDRSSDLEETGLCGLQTYVQK